jgi:hypothetical protein
MRRRRAGALLEHDGEAPVVARRGIRHRIELVERQRGRLLADHVEPGIEGGDRLLGVHAGRGAHLQHVGDAGCEQLREGVEDGGHPPALGEGVGVGAVAVDDGDELRAGRRQEDLGVGVGDRPGADDRGAERGGLGHRSPQVGPAPAGWVS